LSKTRNLKSLFSSNISKQADQAELFENPVDEWFAWECVFVSSALGGNFINGLVIHIDVKMTFLLASF